MPFSFSILIFVLICFIFCVMNIFYNFEQKQKIKKYLLNCKELEKRVLKSILTENKTKQFSLTKKHLITKKLIDLKIIFKLKDNELNKEQFICCLNLKILDLIVKDPILKQIYL